NIFLRCLTHSTTFCLIPRFDHRTPNEQRSRVPPNSLLIRDPPETRATRDPKPPTMRKLKSFSRFPSLDFETSSMNLLSSPLAAIGRHSHPVILISEV